MNKYEKMEVRGTLPQVGFWEVVHGENFDRFKFKRSKIGKYVNIVVVYDSKIKIISVYFFNEWKDYIKIINIEFFLSYGYQFEDGTMFWSDKDHSREDARNVFRALYRNSSPEE